MSLSGMQGVDVNGVSSPAWVDDAPMSLTSSSMIAKPPAVSIFMDGALVGKGAEAPKSCLSPVEMRTPIAAGGLLPAGTVCSNEVHIFPDCVFLGASVKRPRREPAGQTSTSFPPLLGRS